MKTNEVTTAAEDRDHWRGDTTRRQPFIWRKALNDDESLDVRDVQI